METLFYGETFRAWFHAAMTWLGTEVFTPAHIVYTAMQVPAVLGTGFAAWWVRDFVYPLLAERIKQSALLDVSKWILLTLASLIFPVLWMIGLWASATMAIHFEWPHDAVRVAINLLTAWIVIRLASILVRDPIWSRAIVVVAYTVAALNILHLLGPTLALLDGLSVAVGDLRISVLSVLQGMLSLGVLLWAAMLLARLLERRIQEVPNLTPSLQVLFGKLLKATLITLAVIVSLATVGIDLTAIAVFSGAVGVGVGFGLQKVVSNLISGVILLLDKSIKPGDIVQIGDTYGWVASLGARYVSVETRDGIEYLIPNEDIITQQVVNWSHKNDLARIKVRVPVAYYSDIRKALDLMVEAAGRPARVLNTPAPRALVIGFTDKAVDLELRFWIRDVSNGIRNISSDVMLEIWDIFHEHGVKIPFPPQQAIHIRSLPSAMAAPFGPSGEASSSGPQRGGVSQAPGPSREPAEW